MLDVYNIRRCKNLVAVIDAVSEQAEIGEITIVSTEAVKTAQDQIADDEPVTGIDIKPPASRVLVFGILLVKTSSSSVVGVGDTLTIVAQMSEAISPSSSNTVTIGSVDVVMSVDADDPSVMTGTYVVPRRFIGIS